MSKTASQWRRGIRTVLGMVTALAGIVAVAEAPVGMLAWPPDGTVVSIERVVSGSHGPAGANFGSVGGRVSWKFEKRDWRGRTVVAAVSDIGSTFLYESEDGALIAVLDPKGKLLFTYEPALRTDWPLEVGKTWTAQTRMTEESFASKPVIPEQITYSVEALEEVTVPAGTFKAYKVVAKGDVGRAVSERWVVPTLGLFGDFSVKGSDERRAAIPLGPGRREWTLVARTPP